jgi:hypothetical protein
MPHIKRILNVEMSLQDLVDESEDEYFLEIVNKIIKSKEDKLSFLNIVTKNSRALKNERRLSRLRR